MHLMLGISVALATYNGEAYLARQLDSLAMQTAKPSELVVSDDQSADRTVDIISEFAKTAPFNVRVLRNKERLGYRANFMRAAAACCSDLIAFCDQDDIWKPEKLALIRRPFVDPSVLLAYHNAILINAAGLQLGTLFRSRTAKIWPPLMIHPWAPIPGHVQAMRRSLLKLSGLHSASLDPYCKNELMPHDYWYPFWASVLGRIAYIPAYLTLYRQHDGNSSGWPHIGYLGYIRDHISNAADYARAEMIGANNRLDLLRLCREFLAADEPGRIKTAIDCYKKVEVRSQSRLAIYEGASVPARVRALVKLLSHGDYFGTPPIALGLPALLLDSAIGVPFGTVGLHARRGRLQNAQR